MRSRSRTATPDELDDLLGISLFRWGQYTRLDRIDLHLEVPTLPYAQLTDAARASPPHHPRACWGPDASLGLGNPHVEPARKSS